MADNKDILQNLQQLGLTKKESEIYTFLSNRDSDSVYKISTALNIPRSNVYRICESLVEKRFAEWVVLENSKHIRINNPSELSFLKREKENELETVSSTLLNLQEMISERVSHAPKTQMRFYQGKAGIKQIMWNALQAEKETFGYSQFGRVDIVGEKFTNQWVDEFNLRKLSDRAITNEKFLNYIRINVIPSEKKHQLKESDIKVIDSKIFYVSGDTTIYNNTYAICYWDKGEVVGVEIENPELVKLQKSIFEILWKIADPLDKYI